VRGPDGDIWFCEYTGQRVRKIHSNGTLETIVGTGQKGYSGDRGAALEATMNLPHEIRFDSTGDLYIVDMQNHAIRKVELATMRITTIAGTGSPGYSGDGGPAIEAQFKQPHSIQFGPDGDLYVCDIGNHAIRRIDIKTQRISTYAGTGVPGPTPDEAPLRATPLNGPRSIDFDQQGDLWLATREGNQVFRIDRKQGRYEHVAGTGQNGLAGDGGPAKLAKLKGPKGIALDNQGGVWLADTESHCVRRIDTNTGLIERIAGTGIQGDGPVGDPLECKLARLHGIYVDRDGSILIGDSQAHRIRRLYREK
jgi:streptogramin lyase